MEEGILTIGADAGFAGILAIVIYRAIDIFKNIAYFALPDKWVNKLPSWVWLAISVVLGTGICVAFGINVLSSITNTADIPFSGITAQIASGFLISTSSNVVNQVVKNKKGKDEGRKIELEEKRAVFEEKKTAMKATPPKLPEDLKEPQESEKTGGFPEVLMLKKSPVDEDLYVYAGGKLYKKEGDKNVG